MADFPDQWPIAAFHFRVTIDGEQISFQEVSGLDHEVDVIEYRHGDSEVFSNIKLAGLTKTTDLTCKKGVFKDDDRLLELMNQVYEKDYYSNNPDSRMDILVELLDETGDTMMTWNITNAFPIKLTGPSLNSGSSEVAVEEIVFTYEGLETSLAG